MQIIQTMWHATLSLFLINFVDNVWAYFAYAIVAPHIRPEVSFFMTWSVANVFGVQLHDDYASFTVSICC